MNAQALARVYAALVGPIDGQRFLSEARVRLATAPEPERNDLISGTPVRRGLGYELGGYVLGVHEPVTTFGHTGAGGSVGFADPVHQFSLALTKTRLVGGPVEESAAFLVTREIRESLGL